MNWYRAVTYPIIAGLLLLLYFSMPRGHGERSWQVKITVEIGQLQTAVQALKERHGEYFPCLAEPNRDDRKVRFMKYLAKAHPHSSYGETIADFDKLNARIQNGVENNRQVYNFLDDQEKVRPLDLTTLDAAESLVFWLGGFPTPVDSQQKQPIADRRIFGFHRDADDPMRRDVKQAEAVDPLRYRTDPFYQFDETRLVDQDDDGWLEYLPLPVKGSGIDAPFVYFDARCYVATSNDPKLLGSVRYPDDPKLADVFGYVSPYASSYNPATHAVTWHNPDSFQIISGGLDEMFGVPTNVVSPQIVVVPRGDVYSPPTSNHAEALSTEEQDNLTNLSNDTLEGWRQAAGS